MTIIGQWRLIGPVWEITSHLSAHPSHALLLVPFVLWVYLCVGKRTGFQPSLYITNTRWGLIGPIRRILSARPSHHRLKHRGIARVSSGKRGGQEISREGTDVNIRQKDRARVGSFARAIVQCRSGRRGWKMENGTQKVNWKGTAEVFKGALKKGVVLEESSSAIIYMNSRYLDSREDNQKEATRGAVAMHMTCKKVYRQAMTRSWQ